MGTVGLRVPGGFVVGTVAALVGWIVWAYTTYLMLGAALARLESRVALEDVVRRFPRYTVDEECGERVHMSNVHRFESVPFAAS